MEKLENIKKSLLLVQKLNLNEQFEFLDKNQHFEDATKILLDKKHIQTSILFIRDLSKLINYNKPIIQSRIFLSTFLIVHFHKDVFGNTGQPNEIEKDLLSQCQTITKDLMTIDPTSLQNVCQYITKLYNFNKSFETWKKKDYNSQLAIYKELYLKYQKEIDNIKKLKHPYTNEFTQMQNKIKDCLLKLTGKTNIDEVIGDDEKYVEPEINKDVEKLIHQHLKKAYWEKINQECNSSPPNYSSLLGLFGDIRGFFVNIHKHRSKKLKYLDEILDMEYLKIQLDGNFMTVETMNSICKTLLEELGEIDSKEFDKANKKYMLELTNNNIVLCLQFITERLDWISNVVTEVDKIKSNH